MKRLLSLFTACAFLLLSPAALAQEAPTPTEAKAETVISATGTNSLKLDADIAVLTLGVRATGSTVTAAQGQVDAVLALLNEALAGLGVAEADIETSGYSVQTVYNYQYTKLGETETPSGYTVTTDIVLHVRDVDLVGTVIDAAILSGAESSYDLSFESSEQEAAYAVALSEATRDAMRKAQLLAEASGFALGELRSVTETNVQAAYADQSPNALSVTATVEVCYAAEAVK